MFKKAIALTLVAMLLSIVVASDATRPTLAMGQQIPGLQPDKPRRWSTIDDQFASIAERVPAFGGMFVDEANDVLYVYLVNPAEDKTARAAAAIAAAFDGDHIPQDKIRALPGQYGFRKLKAWHDRMMTDVLNIPGVVFTDIDDAKNRLAVGVETLEVQPLVEEHLAKLDIPRDAVNVEETKPVKFESSLQDRHRGLVGGLQISTASWICTMGFPATRAGVRGFVTNSHCTNTQGGVEGTRLYQPTFATGNRIGVETVDPQYRLCPLTSLCRYSDASFVRLDDDVTSRRGAIARPATLGTLAWNGVATFRIISEADPVVGRVVRKVGRTTGMSAGTVSRTCTNVNVSASPFRFLCQAQANYASSPGDSGSPVFSLLGGGGGNDVRLNGIHWGSNGSIVVFSPIGNIQRSDELGPLSTCDSGFTC